MPIQDAPKPKNKGKVLPSQCPNVLEMKKIAQSFERRGMFCRFGRRLNNFEWK